MSPTKSAVLSDDVILLCANNSDPNWRFYSFVHLTKVILRVCSCHIRLPVLPLSPIYFTNCLVKLCRDSEVQGPVALQVPSVVSTSPLLRSFPKTREISKSCATFRATIFVFFPSRNFYNFWIHSCPRRIIYFCCIKILIQSENCEIINFKWRIFSLPNFLESVLT